jgi:uncharacterized protein with PIN domain
MDAHDWESLDAILDKLDDKPEEIMKIIHYISAGREERPKFAKCPSCNKSGYSIKCPFCDTDICDSCGVMPMGSRAQFQCHQCYDKAYKNAGFP